MGGKRTEMTLKEVFGNVNGSKKESFGGSTDLKIASLTAMLLVLKK
ncbi:MAG: hypothetical protein KAI16_01180 [Candidatus Pacebacteria bacterium]|nr:hypothetical protein [Candidatus Paceibacterota bacterium]